MVSQAKLHEPMKVALGEEGQRIVRDPVAGGRFRNAEEVVEAALRQFKPDAVEDRQTVDLLKKRLRRMQAGDPGVDAKQAIRELAEKAGITLAASSHDE